MSYYSKLRKAHYHNSPVVCNTRGLGILMGTVKRRRGIQLSVGFRTLLLLIGNSIEHVCGLMENRLLVRSSHNYSNLPGREDIFLFFLMRLLRPKLKDKQPGILLT
jgi:hypothetical protein